MTANKQGTKKYHYNCLICGKKVRRPDRNKYCSRKCYYKSREKLLRHCYRCGKYLPKEEFYYYGNRYHSMCKKCHSFYMAEWALKNKDKRKVSDRKQADKIRMELLNHYSNGKLECACCGEKMIEFLCLDHINGGGHKERQSLKSHGGKVYYYWLKKQGFPKGIQVLCHNCNMAKSYYGSCPHKLNEKEKLRRVTD